jgi:hypothetical protein
MRRAQSLLRPGTVLTAAVLALLLVIAPTSSAAGSAGLTITPTIDGIPGANGWYRGSTHGNFVVLHWTISDPSQVISTSGCELATRIDGPNKGTTRTCTATTSTGSVSVTTNPIKIDADPPTAVAARPSRPADANGWYNHPVAVSWSGTDATSGLASCTSMTYGGPDTGSGAVAGGCLDVAGNGATAGFAFKYDATAPVLAKVSVRSGAQADAIRWRSSSPADVAVVRRIARGKKTGPMVFRGAGATFTDKSVRADTEYRYLVQTFDQAGNASKERAISAMPKVVTLGPNSYVPRAAERPILRWSKVRGASYYHVQLFKSGKRILAVWPLSTQLNLRQAWKWAGHRYRLGAGRYRWYAWAGFGARSAQRYKLLGHGDFAVG